MNRRLRPLFSLALGYLAVVGVSAGFADEASNRPKAQRSEPAVGAKVRSSVLPAGVRRSAASHSLRQTQQAAVVRVAVGMSSLEDIVRMGQDSFADNQIIDRIRASGAIYHLTADQLIYLNQNGVHEPVIRELQATVNREPRRIYIGSVPAQAAPLK